MLEAAATSTCVGGFGTAERVVRWLVSRATPGLGEGRLPPPGGSDAVRLGLFLGLRLELGDLELERERPHDLLVAEAIPAVPTSARSRRDTPNLLRYRSRRHPQPRG